MSNWVRLAALMLLFAVGAAQAHTSGASYLTLRSQDDATVRAEWDFDLRDLHQLLNLDANGDGTLSWGEITQARAAIEAEIFTRTRLTAGGNECSVITRDSPAIAEHGAGPYLRVIATFSCAAGALALDHSGWFELDSGHRALLSHTTSDGASTQAILSQTAPQWRATESTWSRLQRFLFEGAHHLIIGYDHLAFLGVLLLALARTSRASGDLSLGRMLRGALVVITAFTLAHSLTLGLAATGYLRLPERPVEVAIAASVLLAALLNLRRGSAHHGWKLAFAFGLVHGLGFAGALAELATERIDLLALAAFNVGIEAAQVAVALAAIPVMWWLFRDLRTERIAIPVTSVVVACWAAVWVGERVLGS
jgi:hypothetical protein